MKRYKTMDVKEALRLIGSPAEELHDKEDVLRALEYYKTRMIAARTSGDEELQKKLSQARNIVRKYQYNWCGTCGTPKRGQYVDCTSCRRNAENPFTRVLNVPIRDDREIPACHTDARSPIRKAMARLTEIGQSIEIPVQQAKRKNIGLFAKRLGIEIITRRTENTITVWRTDGKTREEVNAIIQERKLSRKNGNQNIPLKTNENVLLRS